MKVKKLTDKNIQELIELYKSGKLANAENKVTAEINKNPNLSQRNLANKVQYSLGKLNYCLIVFIDI